LESFRWDVKTKIKRNMDTIKELNAINLIRENHVKAVNSTDVQLLLRDMSPDIVYLAPDLQPIEGKESLREFITPIYEVISATIEMIPKDIKILDKIAIEWGIINGEIRQKGIDSAQYIKNKYVFVYEQSENGGWMITKDIYNDIEE
jgi:ketosteroid isomerase-like protein